MSSHSALLPALHSVCNATVECFRLAVCVAEHTHANLEQATCTRSCVGTCMVAR